MTVLHAISVAGGIYRPMSALSQLDPALAANTDVTLRRGLAGALLRSARLTTELADRSVLEQPPEISAMMQDAVVDHNAKLEELLFEARRSFRGRELESRERAQAALRSQISALRSQLTLNDTQKALALKEQASTKALIDKGLSPASKGMEMERMIAEIDAGRAQIQSDLTNAESSLAGGATEASALEDERRLQLQGEQERTHAQAEEIQRFLGVTAEAQAGARDAAGSDQLGTEKPDDYKYTILRTEHGVLKELKADELTPIQPGDLIRVRSLGGPPLSPVSGIGTLGLPWDENGDSVTSFPPTGATDQGPAESRPAVTGR
jgi:exopolysaccharide production protein ExoF